MGKIEDIKEETKKPEPIVRQEEIRIGNWFHHLPTWSYRQPKNECDEFYFQWNATDWYALGECTLDLDIIEPIELNPDILIKAAFEKAKNDEVPYFGGYLIDITKGHKIRLRSYASWYTWESQFGIIEFRYLHQLQNLFFRLTGTELNINLTEENNLVKKP